MFCKSYRILSNIVSSVSTGVFNIGKSKVKKNGGREIIDVDFGEVIAQWGVQQIYW